MAKLPTVSEYFRNVGQSAKFVFVKDIKAQAGFIVDNYDRNKEVIDDVRSMTKNKKFYYQAKKEFKRSEVFRDSNTAYKNLKNSLKSGKFYDEKRADAADEKSFISMMGGENPFAELDKLDSEFESLDNEASLDNESNELDKLDSDLDEGLKASSSAISDTVLESAKYTSDTIKGATAMSYIQSSKILATIQTGFSGINSSLQDLIGFNKDFMNVHIQNSAKFFESTNTLLTEQNAMLKEMVEMQRNLYRKEQSLEYKETNRVKRSDILLGNGVIDLAAYKKRIGQNFENSNSMEMLKLFWNMRDGFIANPMEILVSMGLNFLGKSTIENSIKNLQRTLNAGANKVFNKIDKLGKDSGFLSIIGELLGVGDSRKRTVDVNKYEKGPMQFNGYANKSIVEIIPSYLARIEAALTGNIGNERIFNFKTGKWTDTSSVTRSFEKEMKYASSASSFSERQFYNKIGDTVDGISVEEDKLIVFQRVYEYIRKDPTRFTIGKTDEEFIKQFSGVLDISKKSVRLLLKLKRKYYLSLTGGELQEAIHVTPHEAIERQKSILEGIENDPMDVRRLLFNNSTAGVYTNPFEQQNILSTQPHKKTNRTGRKKAIATTRSISKPSSNYYSNDKTQSLLYDDVGGFIDENIVNCDNSKEFKAFAKYLASLKDLSAFSKSEPAVTDFIKYVKQINESKIAEKQEIYADFIRSVKKSGFKYTASKYISTNSREFEAQESFIYALYSELSVDMIESSDQVNTVLKAINGKDKKQGLDTYDGKNFIDKFRNASGMEKLGVIKNYAKSLANMPANILSGIIKKTDDIVYEMFFGKTNEITDKKGRKVTGFLNRIAWEITKTFNDAREWIKETLKGESIWKEVKSQARKLGTSATGVIGESIRTFGSDVKTSIKYLRGSDDDRIKMQIEAFEKQNGGINDDNIENVLNIIKRFKPKDYEEYYENNPNSISAIDEYTKKFLLNKYGVTITESDSGLATGTPYVPKTGLYMLSKGEAVVPSVHNPYNPNKNTSSIYADKNRENAVLKSGNLKIQGNYAKGTAKAKKIIKNIDGSNVKDNNEKLWDVLKEQYPTIVGKSVVAGGIGAVLGGPFGLILGAGLATADTLLRRSSTVNKFLFGDTESKGLTSRLFSFLPDSIKEYTTNKKEAGKDIGHYAVAGGGLGLASSLMGGPLGLIGGIALGGIAGYLKNNESVRIRLFGDIRKRIPSGVKKLFTARAKHLKAAGMGGLLGAVSVGGPFGLIGGAVLGSALSMAGATDSFKTMLFGDKKTGKKGVLGGVGEKINKVFEDVRDKALDYMREAVFDPLLDAMLPISKLAEIGIKGTTKAIGKMIRAITDTKMKMQWWKDISGAMKQNPGLTGILGGGLAGFATMGPIGAIIGGLSGGVLQKTGLTKKALKLGINITKGPGWLISKAASKVNQRLISAGKIDAKDMTASERLEYMRTRNLSYKGNMGKKSHDNDIAISQTNAAQLQVISAHMKIIRAAKKKNKFSFNKIATEVKNMIRGIDGLSLKEKDRIMKRLGVLIELDQENITRDDIQECINDIETIIDTSKGNLSSKERSQIINIIRMDLPLLLEASRDAESIKEMESNARNSIESGEFSNGFKMHIGDGDDFSNLIDTELEARKKKGETPEASLKETLESVTNKDGDSVALITKSLADDKLISEASKSNSYLYTMNLAMSAMVDIMSGKKNGEGVSNFYSYLKNKDTENEKVDLERKGKRKYQSRQIGKAVKYSSKNSRERSKVRAGKLNKKYGASIGSGSLESFRRQSGDVYNMILDDGGRFKDPKLSKEAIEFIVNRGNVDKSAVIRLRFLSNHNNKLTDTGLVEQLIDMTDADYRHRIVPLAKLKFKFTDFSEILGLDDREFAYLEYLVKFTRKSLSNETTQESYIAAAKDAAANNTPLEKMHHMANNKHKKSVNAKYVLSHNKNSIKEALPAASAPVKEPYSPLKSGDMGDPIEAMVSAFKQSENTKVFYDNDSKTIKTFTKAADGEWIEDNTKTNNDADDKISEERSRWAPMLEYYRRMKEKAEGVWGKAKSIGGKIKKAVAGNNLIAAIMNLFRALMPGLDLGQTGLNIVRSGIGIARNTLGPLWDPIKRYSVRFASKIPIMKGFLSKLVGGAVEEQDAASKMETAAQDVESQMNGAEPEQILAKSAGLLAGINVGIANLAGITASYAGGDITSTVANATGALAGGKGAAKVAGTLAGGKAVSKVAGRLGKFGKYGTIAAGLLTAGGLAYASSGGDTQSATATGGPIIDANGNAVSTPSAMIDGKGNVIQTNLQQSFDRDGYSTDMVGMQLARAGNTSLQKTVMRSGDMKSFSKLADGYKFSNTMFTKTGSSAIGKVDLLQSKVVSWVTHACSSVLEWSEKFIPAKARGVFAKIPGKLISKLSAPSICGKLVAKLATRASWAIPVVGQAILAGMIGMAFYAGYNDAARITSKNDPSIVDKVIAGLVTVFTDVVCLGLIDPAWILQLVAPMFSGTTEAEVQGANSADANSYVSSSSETDNKKSSENSNNDSIFSRLKKKVVSLTSSYFGNFFGSDNSTSNNNGSQNNNNSQNNNTNNNNGNHGGGGYGRFGKGVGPLNPYGFAKSKNGKKGSFYYSSMAPTDKPFTGGPAPDDVSNAAKIWRYLENKKMGSVAIAGIMGNLQQESDFNPRLVEGGAEADTPRSGIGYGLAQWTYPTRQDGLVTYAKNNNKSPSDLEVQLDYMLHEIDQNHPGLIKRMSDANSVEQATRIFHDVYERSADTEEMLQRRVRYANTIFGTLGQGKSLPNGYTSSGSSQQGGSSGSSGNGVFDKISSALQKELGKYSPIFGNMFGSKTGENGSSGGGVNGGTGTGGNFVNDPNTYRGRVTGISADNAKAWMQRALEVTSGGSVLETGEYSENRSDHIHGGVDLAPPAGTPVPAAASGTVVDFNKDEYGNGYGNFIQIKDEKGNYHLYPHLLEPVSGVFNVGQHIEKGRIIGKIGSTGRSTGPHLHYEIDPPDNIGAMANGPHINPNLYKLPGDSEYASAPASSVSASTSQQSSTPGTGGPDMSHEDLVELSDKLGDIKVILSAILTAIQNSGAMAGAQPAIALPEPVVSGSQRMDTTTPGKNILSMVENMIKVATH